MLCGCRSVALLIIISVTCAAQQIQKIDSENIMDAAMDMKRAVVLADNLNPDGAKYCNWGLNMFDVSGLDKGISGYLLNHGSKIPDNIAASKMWRVGYIVVGLVNQLMMGTMQCRLRSPVSSDARIIYSSASSVLQRLLQAQDKFERLAYQQTGWEEQRSSQDKSEVYNKALPDTGQVAPAKFLRAIRDVQEAAEAAAKVTSEAQKTKGCSLDSGAKAPELDFLSRLVSDLGGLERTSRLPGYVPAGHMWEANFDATAAQLDIAITSEVCTPYPGQNRGASNMSSEALQAYHRLRAANATLYSQAIQQTEWEEQNIEKRPAVTEQ